MSKKKTNTDGPYIWLVRGHGPVGGLSRGWRPFEAPLETEKTPEEILRMMDQIPWGVFFSEDQFPKKNYIRKDGIRDYKLRIPQVFSNGFPIIRKESADILRRFDLGLGALYPTSLWKRDLVTQVPGEFFYLNQGNKKDALLLEESAGLRDRGEGYWTLEANPVDDMLAFSPAALDGPDIWWDKRIYGYYFISDRLRNALKTAALTRDWYLLRCKIKQD